MKSDQMAVAVQACASAHRALIDDIAGLGDDQAHQPSLLPGWTIGHILSHLARNADGFSRIVEGAERGETVAMYEHGREGRDADIEAGADRSAAALLADLGTATARLDWRFEQCSELGWDGHGITFAGETSVRDMPARRRGEVEIHRVDLGLGYTFSDWPADYLRSELARMTGQWASRKPMGFSDLPAAALALAPADRFAWLIGRLQVEGLPPAGLY